MLAINVCVYVCVLGFISESSMALRISPTSNTSVQKLSRILEEFLNEAGNEFHLNLKKGDTRPFPLTLDSISKSLHSSENSRLNER